MGFVFSVSAYLLTRLHICLPIYLSTFPSTLSPVLNLYLITELPILSACLLSVLSACLSVCLFVCLYVCLSVCHKHKRTYIIFALSGLDVSVQHTHTHTQTLFTSETSQTSGTGYTSAQRTLNSAF